jgi:hypothetical protein
VGGPVAPATGWLMYRRLPRALPGEMALGPDLAVTGEASALLPAGLEVDLLFGHTGNSVWDEAYQRAIGAVPAVFSSRPAKA